jgi:GNAT superfamily N-acetyltransferase
MLLYEQLGYRVSREEAEERLQEIERDEGHAAFVAAASDGEVVGWVHVYLRLLVEHHLRAEVGALVVAEEYRRRGIGELLMQHAEEWARSRGCWAVHLRSNVIREETHLFYEKIGYRTLKEQRVFQKVL